jgi:lipopolysaccharide transport system permease protein
MRSETSSKSDVNERRRVHIRKTSGWHLVNLPDIWRYRYLLRVLMWRDIRSMYRQTALGLMWAVIQAIATTGVFTLIFGGLADLPSQGLPYPVFTLSGLLPWQLFSKIVTLGGGGLLAMRDVVSKVYFPRILALIVPTASALLDFVIGMAVLFALMTYFDVTPDWKLLVMPVFVLLGALAGLAVAVWIAALTAEMRDLIHAIPVLVTLGIYATPIVYPTEVIPPAWQLLYALNPMVGVIEGFRWAVLGEPLAEPHLTVFSLLALVPILVVGLLLFNRAEKTFIDRV